MGSGCRSKLNNVWKLFLWDNNRQKFSLNFFEWVSFSAWIQLIWSHKSQTYTNHSLSPSLSLRLPTAMSLFRCPTGMSLSCSVFMNQLFRILSIKVFIKIIFFAFWSIFIIPQNLCRTCLMGRIIFYHHFGLFPGEVNVMHKMWVRCELGGKKCKECKECKDRSILIDTDQWESILISDQWRSILISDQCVLHNK